MQSVYSDGSLSLHTRSLKYGKVGLAEHFQIAKLCLHNFIVVILSSLALNDSSTTVFMCIKLFIVSRQLKEGTLVQVPPSLVKRCKTHFLNLPCGATVIVGNNGYVWISPLENEDATPTDGLANSLESDTNSPRQVSSGDCV